jgi:kynurenine formamidase
MCVAGCQEVVMRTLSRRGFFTGAAGAAAAGFAATALPAPAMAQGASFSKVVDLTHTLTEKFPTFGNEQQVWVERVLSIEKDGYTVNKWTIIEHVGTHMDAPLHFSANGTSADKLAPEVLVVPLAVVDVRAKAEANADYQVTPDDVRAWESANGRLPDNACVAMNSGWDRHVGTPKFRNADAQGGMHFPGFHGDTAEFLLKERRVQGIVVDTLSLDHGASKDFKTHVTWLPAGRWGIEGAANLGQCPPKGATIVVGGPKIEGATGGPSRVFALV